MPFKQFPIKYLHNYENVSSFLIERFEGSRQDGIVKGNNYKQ